MNPMKVKFYGVRGSYPVPGPDTVKYGGNTTCVSITKFEEKGSQAFPNGRIIRLIIDGGSGLVSLGKEMVGNFFQKKEDLSFPMLFTHLHPDHTQGFPFFAPNYFPSSVIHLYGMKTLKKHVGKILADAMLPPTFPIEYKDLKNEREHHSLRDGQKLFFGFLGGEELGSQNSAIFQVEVMQAFAPSHPQQGALYYKVTDVETGKSVVCIWDNESKIGGDKAVVKFATGADLMIHDTQYTSEEYISDQMIVQGFGHSTYEMAIENAEQAEIERLVCMHYNPAHTDKKLDEIQEAVKKTTDIDIVLAQEGMEIDV